MTARDGEFGLLRSLRDTAKRHLGPIVDRHYGLGDPGAVARMLGEAGLRDVRWQRITRTLHRADGPGTRMNGNNDGVPCQEQWCN